MQFLVLHRVNGRLPLFDHLVELGVATRGRRLWHWGFSADDKDSVVFKRLKLEPPNSPPDEAALRRDLAFSFFSSSCAFPSGPRIRASISKFLYFCS